MLAAQWEGCPQGMGFFHMLEHPLDSRMDSQQQNHVWGLTPASLLGCGEATGHSAREHASGDGR